MTEENKIYRIEGKELYFDREAFESGYDLMEALEYPGPEDTLTTDFEWVGQFDEVEGGDSIQVHFVIRHKESEVLYMFDTWCSSQDGIDYDYSDWSIWREAKSVMRPSYEYA
jgi:hypothetical protein